MKELAFSECWYWFLLAAVVCYFIGCFNFAVLISHFKKKDIRTSGSGNPGTLNMTRTFGLKVGAINFLCDILKGGLPAVAAHFIFRDFVFAGTDVWVSDFARYFCGIFVIIGHIFPVTMKFKGGKGIASTIGLLGLGLTCECAWYLPICFGVGAVIVLYIAVTEMGSMGSLLAVASFTVWQGAIFFIRYQNELLNVWLMLVFMILLSINLLTWGAHHKNIFKLLAGEEHHTAVIKNKGKKKEKRV